MDTIHNTIISRYTYAQMNCANSFERNSCGNIIGIKMRTPFGQSSKMSRICGNIFRFILYTERLKASMNVIKSDQQRLSASKTVTSSLK